MTYWTKLRSHASGFTLVELIITVAIVSTLLALSTIAFRDWMLKSRVEAQTREMFADFNQVRVRAMTTKLRHKIIITPGSYIFQFYSSEDEPPAGGKTIPGGTRTVFYRLKKNASDFYTGAEFYEVDQRGMIDMTGAVNNVIPIYLDYNGNASVDCLNLTATRVNFGKRNTLGDKCDAK